MATIGYARVSTDEQSTAVQIEQLEALGCDKLFVENASGKNAERSQLKAMLDYVREGDTVVAMKVDRLARSTIDALVIADQLQAKGCGLVLKDLGEVDINSDVGRVIYTCMSAFAEMERKRILQRCNEGRAKAKADGKHLGRKADTALHDAIKQLHAEGLNKSAIANQLNISRTTVYSVLN